MYRTLNFQGHAPLSIPYHPVSVTNPSVAMVRSARRCLYDIAIALYLWRSRIAQFGYFFFSLPASSNPMAAKLTEPGTGVVRGGSGSVSEVVVVARIRGPNPLSAV